MRGGQRQLLSVHYNLSSSRRNATNWQAFSSSPPCLSSAFRGGHRRCFSSVSTATTTTSITTPTTPSVVDVSDDKKNDGDIICHRLRRHRHRRAVTVYNELHRGCLSYKQTWAWQQVLLQQRIVETAAATASAESKPSPRRQEEEEENSFCDEKRIHNDCILIVEHEPVYTLGRGADENHLAFLEKEGDDDNGKDNGSVEKIRRQLSRKSRGPGSARLCLDRHIEEGLKRKLQQQHIESIKPATKPPSVSTTPSPVHFSRLVDELLTEMGGVQPVMAPNDVPVYRVERGGEVTYHGPSQLVVYPIFNLRQPPGRDDLHWYLRTLEQVIIDTLQHYGIVGTRDEINTGVWVGQDKVAAVGIAASRWITHHGFALNVDPQLSYFDTEFILPCGIEGRGVTSMGEILRGQGQPVPSMNDVAEVVKEQMRRQFDVHIE